MQRTQLKKIGKRITIFTISCFVLLFVLFWLLNCLYPFPMKEFLKKQSPQSLLIYDQEGNVLGERVSSKDMWRLVVQGKSISPWLKKATVAIEDENFYYHPGVNPLSVVRACCQNLRNLCVISGASTITMQCMRLLHPRPRNIRSKIIEMFRALQFEMILSKDEILAFYLNNAPYGGNIIGAGAASWKYFQKPVSQLSCAEAALLAGIPQSPARLNPRVNFKLARKRQQRILKYMYKIGFLSKNKYDLEKKIKVRITKAKSKSQEHICDYVLSKYGRNGIIHSTIKSQIQKKIREIISAKSPEFRAKDIDSAAVVVIGVKNSYLRAIFSFPEYKRLPDGQVNRATSWRQGGSILKPFIYNHAFEKGLITPQSRLDDTPQNWSGYKPENFNKKYMGKVEAKKALKMSLNIPAVSLLNKVGLKTIYLKLQKCGLKFSSGHEHYGLSLALGTPEIRLIDITNAYTTLARLGTYIPLSLVKKPSEKTRVYSKAASYMTLDCLMDKSASRSIIEGGKGPGFAFKTGTSWDFRDAWCVYISPEYAVGVWMGNSAGTPSQALIGMEAAVPLAREIIGDIYNSKQMPYWKKPEDIVIKNFDSNTGNIANIYCKKHTKGLFIKGISSSVPYSYSMENSKQNKRIKKTKLTIISPVNNKKYFVLKKDLPGKQNLLFKASINNTKQQIFWFLNGELIAKNRKEVFWQPRYGKHSLVCCCADGNTDKCSFIVESHEKFK